MVVGMIKWRPWPPPLVSRKYEVRLVIKSLEGGSDFMREGLGNELKWTVEIRWKGTSKVALMRSLRRMHVPLKRNFTREGGISENGVVYWDEEFQSVCGFSVCKEKEGGQNSSNVFLFHPWEVGFTVFNAMNQCSKGKETIVGTASVNLAEYASLSEQKEHELTIPMTPPECAGNSSLSLIISLGLVELLSTQEVMDSANGPNLHVVSPSPLREAIPADKDEVSALKAGLKKVMHFTEFVSTRRAKKAGQEEESSEGKDSAQGENADDSYPFDSDSWEDSDGESDETKEDLNARKSFSYGSLAHANCVGGSFYSSLRISGGNEDLIYFSNHKSDASSLHIEDSAAPSAEQSHSYNPKRSILSWRKRKLNFRSSKVKGEPLLKKAYAEEGGDDIDFDRRQLSSDESLASGWYRIDDDSSAYCSSASEFGDDSFSVGSWEKKEIISRDGHMKLQTEVFLASIDQRSERAAGESACTALVAVIADWFQKNPNLMPIKSQFDSLIRDGSLAWRNLCEDEAYREQFPDRHFDLETVLEAGIRPLSVVPDKSFIGFFIPECMGEGRFEFLNSAMSFDEIWDQVTHAESGSEPCIYIVSWNDHFFVLKIESDAYYIIDSLGERLHEGCTQAYILKFDRETSISKVQSAEQSSGTTAIDQQMPTSMGEPKNLSNEQVSSNGGPGTAETIVNKLDEPSEDNEAVETLFQGKEACKEYIKNFLAAIPIRELQEDMRKGLTASKPLHLRLQIEFHFTRFFQPSGMTAAVVQAVGENAYKFQAAPVESTA